MEDVDLEVKLGLESKLVNLIERFEIRETVFDQKASNVTPSSITEGLGNLSLLTDTPLIPEINKTPYISLLNFPGISRKTFHKCEACEKLGYYWGPPPLVRVPACVDFENNS